MLFYSEYEKTLLISKLNILYPVQTPAISLFFNRISFYIFIFYASKLKKNKLSLFANHYVLCSDLQIEKMNNLTKKNKSANWDKFFVDLQSQGRYTFSFDELRRRFDLSEETLLQALYRYKAKKQVSQIRKGFYAIIPPGYSKQGMLPP